MVINAKCFEPLTGTVFVVVYADENQKSIKNAQGVFKTIAAARKLASRIEIATEIRVGHFTSDGNVRTI